MERYSSLLAVFALVLSVDIAPAQDHAPCDGRLVSERDESSAVTDAQCFSFEDLEALPQVSFSTSTIWTNGVQSFQGVPLSEFVRERPGAKTVRLIALNDYFAPINVEKLDNDYPIIAIFQNEESLALGRMGPFWVVYPYDLDKDFQRPEVLHSSVWMLREIEVR